MSKEISVDTEEVVSEKAPIRNPGYPIQNPGFIRNPVQNVKGKIRKRKRNYSLLREESIGSNFESTNPIIKVIGGLPMNTVEEHDILKDVLFDYSKGLFTSLVGDYWSFEFWKSICVEYNRRANSRSLPSCTEANIHTGGMFLLSQYCMLRAVGMEDVKLDTIFKPCEDCNLRIVFFPTSKIAGMNYTSNYVFTDPEYTMVKNVLLDYSRSSLQIQREDYYSASFWNTLADEYNMRVGTEHGLCAGVDMLNGGKKLRHIFNTQRRSGNIDPDLKQIFERCPNCKRRIPVFPLSLFSQSDASLTTSTMRSFRSGTSIGNARANIGNANGGSTSLQITEASHYDVSKLVPVLLRLAQSERIADDVIGYILHHRLPKWNSEEYRCLVTVLLSSDASSATKRYMVMQDYNGHYNPNP
ncbi:hypothetical protein RND81_14G183600 [Saponaria officinalis]|uniref:Uncharacterized protein n=1 Tax=Saponaria officinalis TaxID=3572 RepID=A0AAW1GNF3_SAPOF